LSLSNGSIPIRLLSLNRRRFNSQGWLFGRTSEACSSLSGLWH
jgi:hypothetical protein